MTQVLDAVPDANEPGEGDTLEPNAETTPGEPGETLEPLEGDDGQTDDDADDDETETLDRCDAETTVGGTLYQCALNLGHDGEHAFQPVDAEQAPVKDAAKAMRDKTDKLERENERHYKRIVDIMGDDADALVACELCFPMTPGFRWDAAPPEEQAARVRVALGLPDLTNYPPSSTERTCDDCRGLGKVRTGSSVAGHEAGTCDACGGKGYVPTRPRLNTETPDDTPELGEAVAASVADDGIRRDMFGTPEGDPDYEKMPNARIRPIEYWATNRA